MKGPSGGEDGNLWVGPMDKDDSAAGIRIAGRGHRHNQVLALLAEGAQPRAGLVCAWQPRVGPYGGEGGSYV
jgi:hypothetical protein